MHPSLVHRYGLRSEADVAIAEHLLASASGLNVSEQACHRVLEFYGQHVAKPLAEGLIDSAAALEQLVDFARNDGIAPHDIGGMYRWLQQTGAHMREHGGKLPSLGRAVDLDAQETIALEIEQIMRTDPGRYWSSPGLQHRLYEALEALETGGRRDPPVASPELIGRGKEIEQLMGDPMGTYWRGAESGALQAEYRNILSLGAPDEVAGALAAPAADAAA